MSENALRKFANRQGYMIKKSRRQLGINNQGQYMLVEIQRNLCTLGPRFDADLDEIAEFLGK
jgi:hypothetical protein